METRWRQMVARWLDPLLSRQICEFRTLQATTGLKNQWPRSYLPSSHRAIIMRRISQNIIFRKARTRGETSVLTPSFRSRWILVAIFRGLRARLTQRVGTKLDARACLKSALISSWRMKGMTCPCPDPVQLLCPIFPMQRGQSSSLTKLGISFHAKNRLSCCTRATASK